MTPQIVGLSSPCWVHGSRIPWSPELGLWLLGLGVSAPWVRSIVPQVESMVPWVGSMVPWVGSMVHCVGSMVPWVRSMVHQFGSIVSQVGSMVPRVEVCEMPCRLRRHD